MNRKDFTILNNNLIYFDNAATTLKPDVVINEINKYYLEYPANIHRGEYDISFKADKAYEDVRRIVKSFINASKDEEVIFTSGTTEGINLLAQGYFKNLLKKDDEVLITKSEHASNILPWFNLANEIGIKVNFIPLDDNYEITKDSLEKVINSNTKVISIAGITNTLGDVRDIKMISEIAHKNNITLVIDGAQLVPHMKVDVKELDIDFLTFSGHKLCAGTGIGVLYGKYELLDQVKPIFLGGGMNESFDTVDRVILKKLPSRLEAGTPNIAGVIGLGKAINYLNTIGMDKIRNYEIELKNYLITKLKNISHINLVNEHTKSGIVTFNIDGIFAQDVAYYLNKYNLCLRAGNHCAKLLKDIIGVNSTLRCSIYFYNTKEEIDKLVELLSDINKIKKEMI